MGKLANPEDINFESKINEISRKFDNFFFNLQDFDRNTVFTS